MNATATPRRRISAAVRARIDHEGAWRWDWSIYHPELLTRLHWVDGRGTCLEFIDPDTGENINPAEART